MNPALRVSKRGAHHARYSFKIQTAQFCAASLIMYKRELHIQNIILSGVLLSSLSLSLAISVTDGEAQTRLLHYSRST